jgi:hypothetical protein
VNNIKMDLGETGWSSMDWIDLAQNRDQSVEGSCEYSNEPSDSIKRWQIPEYLQNWLLVKKGSAPWSELVWWIQRQRVSQASKNQRSVCSVSLLTLNLSDYMM